MAEADKHRFYWSRRRDLTFRECLRKYFFDYYGGAGGTSRDREMGILRRLVNRQDWAQGLVRKALSGVWKAVGEPVNPDGEASKLLDSLRREFKESREGAYRQNSAARSLFEHEYGLEVPAAAWKAAADYAEACLRGALASPLFQRLQSAPASERPEVPETDRFNLNGLPVHVRPGLVVRREDRIELVRWRMEGDAGDDPIERAVAVLYGAAKWAAPENQICVVEGVLPGGEEQARTPDAAQIEFAREYLQDSADEMQFPLDDPEIGKASEDAFEPTEEEAPCKHCNYLKICPRWS